MTSTAATADGTFIVEDQPPGSVQYSATTESELSEHSDEGEAGPPGPELSTRPAPQSLVGKLGLFEIAQHSAASEPDLAACSVESAMNGSTSAAATAVVKNALPREACCDRASVCVFLFSAAIHDVSYDSLFTAPELSTLKTWLVRSAKESDCKVTDGGSHVKRVVTRGVWQSREHRAACYWVDLPLICLLCV